MLSCSLCLLALQIRLGNVPRCQHVLASFALIRLIERPDWSYVIYLLSILVMPILFTVLAHPHLCISTLMSCQHTCFCTLLFLILTPTPGSIVLTVLLVLSDKTVKLWKISERDKRPEGYNLKDEDGRVRDPTTVTALKVSCHAF